jgi:hypothetical protein
VAISTVKAIRSELSVLNEEVRMFGKFDLSVNLEELNQPAQILRGIEVYQSPSRSWI